MTPPLSLFQAIDSFDAGNYEAAEAHCMAILNQMPTEPNALHMLGVLVGIRGDFQRSLELLRQAMQLMPTDIDCRKNLGTTLERLGRYDDAISQYNEVLRQKPNDTQGRVSLGLVLVRQGEHDAAAAEFRTAMNQLPRDPVPPFALANVLRHQSHFDEAERLYRTALALNPRFADANAELAAMYEELYRLEEAERVVTNALAFAPNHAYLNLIAARLERRSQMLPEAAHRLERVWPLLSAEPVERKTQIQFELGQLYDLMERTDEAFECFRQANALKIDMDRRAGIDKTRYLQRLTALLEGAPGDWPESWRKPDPGQPPTPCFLVGFPRSGTTLLDQILDSHPRLQTVEEKPALGVVIDKLLRWPGSYPGALANLDANQRGSLRETYFEVIDHWVNRESGKLLLDKLPLNIVHIPLMVRLFPQTKVVITVRHPLDVCLSCFMQNFDANEAMANCNSLIDVAELYAKAMDLWFLYRDIIKPDHHIIRYEDVVVDFHAEIRKLLEFLGVGWDDAVLRYREHAQQRGRINTPSYHQVTQQMYATARYRWQRYQRYLESVIERLRPYIEAFDYSQDGEVNSP